MSNFNCEFCKKTFFNKSNLVKHQNTAKFCLDIQNKEIKSEFLCEYCNKNFTRKDGLDEHIKVCNEKNIYFTKKEINKLKRQLDKQTKTIENQNKTIDELKTKSLEIELYKTLYEEEKQKVVKQQETIEKLASKAIENAGTKTTNINNNNRNQIYNALQPLTDDYMRDQRQYLTYNNIKNGAHGIAHFASTHTFKDRIFCSDKSRLNFVFKNESDNIIKDPEGVEITKRFIEINREELLRLVTEYLNYITTELMDDATSGEMYKFWADKREEFIAIRSAVVKGNVSDNKESYDEFKKNFLLALSNLVPR
jgi:hypothetical protein